MMPALWMTTLRAGWSSVSLAATFLMSAGSSMLRVMEAMPGLAPVVSSRTDLRRPAMMTLLPSLWRDSARARPMPEPPPVMRMVFPVEFMGDWMSVGVFGCDGVWLNRGEFWHTSEMVAILVGWFCRRLTARALCLWLCALGLAACAGPLIAQSAEPVAGSSGTPTLHVYTNLIQIPVLVLSANRQRLPEAIVPSRFSVSIDSGPWFRATHVRPEGDDTISLSILLDLHGDSAELMEKIDEKIASLAPNLLHTKDHVSIYALDCSLVRGASDVPASEDSLKHGVDVAVGSWQARRQMKPAPKCEPTIHLREALEQMVAALSGLPGRRVILAVTDGKDPASKSEWLEATSYAQTTGTAVFGLITYPVILKYASAGMRTGRDGYRIAAEDPFNALCEMSGGMVVMTDSDSMKTALGRFVATLRERYIVEFPRPSNSTAGKHSLAVRVEKADDFIRVAGITVPMPDAAVLADPTTVSAGPSNTPVQGERRVMDKH